MQYFTQGQFWYDILYSTLVQTLIEDEEYDLESPCPYVAVTLFFFFEFAYGWNEHRQASDEDNTKKKADGVRQLRNFAYYIKLDQKRGSKKFKLPDDTEERVLPLPYLRPFYDSEDFERIFVLPRIVESRKLEAEQRSRGGDFFKYVDQKKELQRKVQHVRGSV